MIFSRPNTLIYLQRSSLMVAGKNLRPARLAFSDDLIKNLEVVQPTKLTNSIEQFLRQQKIRGRLIIMVLDASMLFQKVIELDRSGQPDILVQGFVDSMPFEPGHRACLAVQTDTKLRLFAANADLYAAAIDAIRAAGAGKLIAITPNTAYDLSTKDRNISVVAEQFFADKAVRKLADFRTVTPA